MKEITKNMKILDLVNEYPEAAEVLFEAGIHCVGCHLAANESLEQGLSAHGLTEKEIDDLIEKIKEKIKPK